MIEALNIFFVSMNFGVHWRTGFSNPNMC